MEKFAFKGGPKKFHLPQKLLVLLTICILINRAGDKQRPFYRYLSLLVFRQDFLTNNIEKKSWLSMGRGEGGKSKNLTRCFNFMHYRFFHASSSRTHTCKLITLLWPFPRCNEDPVCRNPCVYRIAKHKYTRTTAGQNSFIVRRPLHVEYLVFMGLETVELYFEIPHVPHSYCLISRASSQNILRVGVE